MLYDSIQLFEGSKLSNLVVDSGTSYPSDPNTGELFFHTTQNKLFMYASSGWVAISGGDSFPSQTGNSGKYLTTDGSSTSWAAVDALPSQSGNSGKYLTTNGTAASWASLITIPSLSGNSGKFLTTDGSTVSWAAAIQGAAGSTGQLQYNSLGVLTAASTLSFNGTSTLTVGATDSTFIVRAAAASAIGFFGANLTIQSGASVNSVAVSGGGSGVLTLAGGDGDAGSGSGGDVVIRGGTGPAGPGVVYIRTGNSQTERVRFIANGAWGLGGANYGTSGQVLTSNGSSAAPTWETVSSLPSQTGNSGLFLTTNGSAASWASVYPSQSGNSGKYLTTDGTSVSWETVSSTFSGGTISGATTLSSSLTFGTAYTETNTSVTAAATTTIDCALGNNFAVDMAASITTLTLTNVPVAGRVYSMTLVLKQDNTGNKTVTWPNSVRWPAGSAPTLTTTGGKYDIITLMTNDGGTIWFGFIAGQNF